MDRKAHGSPVWEIERLPFLWAPLDEPFGGPLPAELPFTLGVHQKSGALIQIGDQNLRGALDQAYSLGSVLGCRLEDMGLGRRYAEAFLGFTVSHVSALDRRTVLEIGAGTGYLLSRLAMLGARCTGIEPGDHLQSRYESAGVTMIRDFFPTGQLTELFDVVLLHNLLEHIENVGLFLDEVRSVLAPQGQMLVAVPACDGYIDCGDPSILVHEHFSYFTQATLIATLIEAGFEVISCEPSGVGTSWFVSARVRSRPAPSVPTVDEKGALAFKGRCSQTVARVRDYLVDARTKSQSVALYVPTRAINFVALSESPVDHCRLVDDDPNLQGKYLPGLPLPIEDGHSLKRTPTDRVLILSDSFGSEIRNRIVGHLPPGTKVHLLRDLRVPC